MNDEREQIRMKLEARERVERMKNGGEDMRATLATQEREMGNSSKNEYMSRQEEQLRSRMQNSNADPYRGYGEDQRAMMASWGHEKPSAEDIRKFSEEELKLRDETLSRTAADHDPRYRTISEAYAPTPQGMKAVGSDMKEQRNVYSEEVNNKMSSDHKVRIMDSDANMGSMMEDKAREMNEAHVVEHSAHRAGSTIGSIFSRAKVAARELTDGFREGYSRENKK